MLDDFIHRLLNRRCFVCFRALTDRQHLCFHRVQQRRHLIRRIVGLSDGLVGVLDDRPQHELVLHMLQVVAEMARTRRVSVEIRQPRRPAHPVEQSLVEQSLDQ